MFHALALNATALPTDKSFANQLKAAELLEKVFAEQPNHPGVAHYLIHSFDYPALAELALPAARAYARIAPSAPHALHMPSHIFTRLGLWDESIESNLASAAAARSQVAASHSGATAFDELHALDYLVYAYLQAQAEMSASKEALGNAIAAWTGLDAQVARAVANDMTLEQSLTLSQIQAQAKEFHRLGVLQRDVSGEMAQYFDESIIQSVRR